ncbi:ferrous iron transporter FeoB [Candidatus Methanoperedens nitroreducens]|uniref:Ferrous iron transport protein B n=1 Tax=Candidatus Methanoperedens nitratireducens TaxID=1392998 RepID=A0A062V3T8_9EURY|nr:ferrous iron transport protein B [Candidatus Methanoperedens nitroreducens]KCZ70454.1 ferrous iron transporter FeoB [Candidatus Methanoperedens nitroreducens]MDJ1420892.1 ferrous iron transport protein B [Candidatus Methanoperedens sp.]
MPSCHGALKGIKGSTDYTFVLAGNPNVGKSSIFNRLTGMGVVTANYPGKTVELNMATTTFKGLRIGIIDLPGSYALGAVSEDQWVARRAVLDSKPDAAIMVLDSTNLARNLYMVLQFIDLGIPIVVALNLMDEAEKRNIIIDAPGLSELLGVPVVPTTATTGYGLDDLIQEAIDVVRDSQRIRYHLQYGTDIEANIKRLAELLSPYDFGIAGRALAILLLEEDAEFIELVEKHTNGRSLLEEVKKISKEIEEKHGEETPLRIARERHGLAGVIASQVQNDAAPVVSDKLWGYTTSPLTGIPLLICALGVIFAFLFYGGNWLSTLFSDLWAAYVSPVIDGAIFTIFGEGHIGKTLIWGFDAGILAALAVGIPYVLTFYFMLAFLEDTGYLNSVAFLTDRLMHRFGLHGRAIIPVVAGAGCNVPAIIGTRVLTTMRERTIASALITLIPCSARTAVILGAVSLFVGWKPAVAIYIIVLTLVFFVGVGLNRIMPGSSTGLVMEMFPFRAPIISNIIKKTWYRFKDFVFVAFPIVLAGSLVLGALYETGYLWRLSSPISPVVEGWLGLPAVAGLTLIFAVLRKELALQLLVTLAVVIYGGGADNLLLFMDKTQLFVYALVNTIYIPCVATIAVLGRELGWKRAGSIMAFTITLAILIGGFAYRFIEYFNLL